MNYSQLKNAIAEVIRTNGNEEITGEVLQYTLLEMVSVLGKDYQFAGVGTPLTDTTERDDNVAWILGRGTYENFGNPFTVAVDEIAVVKYDGTFTVDKIKTGVVVDSELTLAGTNPVEGGAIAREFAKMRAAGYFFAGIMTPTGTPPHEITEKIFYLCTQAGVYPNFDSIVLDRGLNILKWNGSRWSADLVFAITDDVTEGLASLLTSAGAYAAIAAEAQLRQEGDAAVQQNIDAVEALIPSQASVDNKLVDEQKMNSSIATATATYRGAYNQVSNLNLGVDATHEQVALALASQMTYLHITPDNNDYCYVLVPTSAETPTEIAHIDRYKYNGTAWGYEYTLNNSGYTAAQWAAINSGITSGLVAKLGALPTAQELAAALLTKQDVLTFDNAPTPSSTNPVTSGGVYTAIDDEKGARVNADAALQQAIEAILLLIPSAATALNQLADKAFVNSSIATATATFRGTFNLVSDLQLTVDATHADIAAALLNAISGADNNDYAFVQIPTSVDTPTEIRVTERYKFNGTAWSYEYDLNNSGFTASQWAAINSGITALLVTKLSNLPNATELAALFAGKQNVLTFDNAPVSGSDNPVKSGGLYNLFAAIDAKMPTGASANNKLVAEDRLAAYVGGIIGTLDATFDLTSTDGHVTLRMTQTDGVITSLQILTSDIASASALATLGGQVSTNADDIAALQALYNALQQSAPQIIEPTDTWPVASPSGTVIYRVIDRVNTPPQYYSDYMFKASDLTTPVLMATYNNAIDAVPTAGSHNLVESGGVKKVIDDLNLYIETTDVTEEEEFEAGRVFESGIFSSYTEWKYIMFNAEKGNSIIYKGQCDSPTVLLGKYISENTIQAIIFGNEATPVEGIYVVPSDGTYILCSYASFDVELYLQKDGVIPVLQDSVENIENDALFKSKLKKKPVVYSDNESPVVIENVGVANQFIKSVELIGVSDYVAKQLRVDQLYYYDKSSDRNRWVNRFILVVNGAQVWLEAFEINFWERPTTDTIVTTSEHLKVTWDANALFNYGTESSAAIISAQGISSPYFVRNTIEMQPDEVINGEWVENNSITEKKLDEEIREKLNSNFINNLLSKKIVSFGDSLATSGIWQKEVADRCMAEFSDEINAITSHGGTLTVDANDSNCAQARAKRFVEQANYVPDYIFLENVNDYIVAPPPYHDVPTDIDDEPFFLASIHDVQTVSNSKALAESLFTSNFSTIVGSYTPAKGSAIRLPYNTKKVDITITSAPSSSGGFSIVTSNGETKNVSIVGNETIEDVVNLIAEIAFEGWTVVKTSSSVVSFISEDSTYTVSISNNTCGIVTSSSESTALDYVVRYFCSIDVSKWSNSDYWKSHPGLYASYKGIVEYLQNAYPSAYICILIPEVWQFDYNSPQYLRADGSRNVDAIAKSYSYDAYLYPIQIAFAQRYNLRVIDLRGKCGINYMNIQNFQPINNVHPYNNAYRRWGEEIVRELA